MPAPETCSTPGTVVCDLQGHRPRAKPAESSGLHLSGVAQLRAPAAGSCASMATLCCRGGAELLAWGLHGPQGTCQNMGANP